MVAVEGQTEVVVTDKEVVNITNKIAQSQCPQSHLSLLMWVISHTIVCKEILMTSLMS